MASATTCGSMSYSVLAGAEEKMGMRSGFPLRAGPIATGRWFERGAPALKSSAEDREPPPPCERVHPVLEGGLDLVVLLVDVGVVLRPLGVVVEVDRVLQRRADLRRQRELGQHRGCDPPRRLDRDREHLQ